MTAARIIPENSGEEIEHMRTIPKISAPHGITAIQTPLGPAGIGWRQGTPVSFIRIYLPGELPEQHLPASSAHAPHPAKATALAACIRRFLSGDAIDFPWEDFDLGPMNAFQRNTLMLCRQIPRGRVAAYGHLAERLKAPRAARAVGTAMARNPLPLVIPCHRVVRANGDPGRFGGGAAM